MDTDGKIHIGIMGGRGGMYFDKIWVPPQDLPAVGDFITYHSDHGFDVAGFVTRVDKMRYEGKIYYEAFIDFTQATIDAGTPGRYFVAGDNLPNTNNDGHKPGE